MIAPILMLDKPYPKSGIMYPESAFKELLDSKKPLAIIYEPKEDGEGQRMGVATGIRIRTKGTDKYIVCDVTELDKEYLDQVIRGEARLTLDMFAQVNYSGPCPVVASVQFYGPVAFRAGPPAFPGLKPVPDATGPAAGQSPNPTNIPPAG